MTKTFLQKVYSGKAQIVHSYIFQTSVIDNSDEVPRFPNIPIVRRLHTTISPTTISYTFISIKHAKTFNSSSPLFFHLSLHAFLSYKFAYSPSPHQLTYTLWINTKSRIIIIIIIWHIVFFLKKQTHAMSYYCRHYLNTHTSDWFLFLSPYPSNLLSSPLRPPLRSQVLRFFPFNILFSIYTRSHTTPWFRRGHLTFIIALYTSSRIPSKIDAFPFSIFFTASHSPPIRCLHSNSCIHTHILNLGLVHFQSFQQHTASLLCCLYHSYRTSNTDLSTTINFSFIHVSFSTVTILYHHCLLVLRMQLSSSPLPISSPIHIDVGSHTFTDFAILFTLIMLPDRFLTFPQ